jgi:nickel-dependent lactate racemase
MSAPLYAACQAPDGQTLSESALYATLEAGLKGRFKAQRVLVLIPDHTRTLPLPLLFHQVVDILGEARQLDFLVALGTHPPLPEADLCRLVGLSLEEKAARYAHIGLFNHAWGDPAALTSLGVLSQAELQALAGDFWHPSLGGAVDVKINRLALDYDHLLILGPTFPHEVVGFSGGAKYLFPGISGADIINFTHWLGALVGSKNLIGLRESPVRAVIHSAAALLPTPITLASLVVDREGVAGLFIGDKLSAFESACALSSARHIRWLEKPVQRVLSCAPPMYDELWTAAKAMYKLEPAIADGGEVIIYAPHLASVSVVHGAYIERIGYHVLDYFLKQWEHFADVPLGVLAHSTHVKGAGTFEEGQEHPRIHVTLASQLSPEQCARLNLGYADPRQIDFAAWRESNDPDQLYVPKAGEILYRVR